MNGINEIKLQPLGNRKLLIVGFCGKAKSGKDSAAHAIADTLTAQGVECEIMAFADPIREIGKIMDFPEDCLTNQTLKESWIHPYLDVTPRKFMQLVGSEMFRNVLDKDVWVKALSHRINAFDEYLLESTTRKLDHNPDDKWSPKGVVLITDVRFPNEAQSIIDRGGYVVRISRYSSDGENPEWRKHESEKFVDELPVSTIFYNDSSSLLHWKCKALTQFVEWTDKLNITFDHSKWYKACPV